MQLQELDIQHEAAFLEMIADYMKGDPTTYEKLYKSAKPWDSTRFKAFVKESQQQRMDWRPGPNKVSVSRYVLVDDTGKVCGNGIMRFPLDEKLEREGGNLRFDVPPSRRGQGLGALVLNGMLFEAVRAGMARVLVTCNADHASAVRAIQRNRGELENTIESKEPGNEGKQVARFWIRFR